MIANAQTRVLNVLNRLPFQERNAQLGRFNRHLYLLDRSVWRTVTVRAQDPT